jgi:hypothetical protein
VQEAASATVPTAAEPTSSRIASARSLAPARQRADDA